MPILLVAPVVTTTLWNSLSATEKQIGLADMFEAYLELLFGPQGPT